MSNAKQFQIFRKYPLKQDNLRTLKHFFMVTLLRMIETYELRMKIISCIVIRTKKPLKIQISAYTYLIEPMSIV